jgi:hypothetical protein
MLGLYQFFWDCGRSGILGGLFIATKEQVESAIGSKVYFGEVLGKHSEIYGTLDAGDVSLISDDQDSILWLQGLMKGNNISGFNPLDYIEESDEEEESEDE